MLIKFNSYTYINLFKHPLLGISINKWMKLLVKNKCNVYVKFLPKIIFLTLFSILNLPFQLFEAIIYSAKIKKTTLKSPVFVIGHPRSGTTYLNNLLSKDNEITYEYIDSKILDNKPELVRTISVKPPKIDGKLRFVKIGTIDFQPCGGTHVKSTNEIGPIKIGKIENKGKMNRRVLTTKNTKMMIARLKFIRVSTDSP